MAAGLMPAAFLCIMKRRKGQNMDKNAYLENGYINMAYVAKRSHGMRVWLIGGRGIGKTYGALQYGLQLGKPFLYLRRTKEQIKDMTKEYFNPFKSLAPQWFISVESIGKAEGRFYTGDPDDKESQVTRGLMLALSGIASLRGFDLSDYDFGVFDEAIPEPHEQQKRGEGLALMNALETINRNRERQGKRRFQMFLLANSNTLNSRILAETGDSSIIQRMMQAGRTYYDTPACTIWIFDDSPVTEWKRTQDLYAGQRGRFADMALNNQFAEDTSQIYSADLRQYKARAVLGDMVVWRDRHTGNHYHVTSADDAPAGALNGVRTFTDDVRGRRECKNALPFLQLAYTQNRVTFSEYALKFTFQDFIY